MHQKLFATEEELITELYEEEPALRQYLFHCGIHPDDMNEVLQDIMITAWRKADTLKDRSSFGAWLRKITQRKAIRYHKNKERYWRMNFPLSHYEEDRQEAGAPVPEGLIYMDPEDFSQSDIYQMVMELGSPASNIMILHYVYREQFDEIAVTLGMNENTIRSIASRSRTKLRKIMEERGIGPNGKK